MKTDRLCFLKVLKEEEEDEGMEEKMRTEVKEEE